MSSGRSRVRILTVVGASTSFAFAPLAAGAQCLPGKHSNEAKLLAHYSAPITFVPLAEPGFAAGRFMIGADLTYIPKPDPALDRAGVCFMPKNGLTQLSPVFPDRKAHV